MKPILHGEDLPIPRPPVSIEDDCDSDTGSHDTCTQGAGTIDETNLLD